jgi:hypothetical protein
MTDSVQGLTEENADARARTEASNDASAPVLDLSEAANNRRLELQTRLTF